MKIYYQMNNLKIRNMLEKDAEKFIEIFKSYGWNNNIKVYKDYFADQEEGKRKVYVAEFDNKIAGYCTLLYNSQNGPWKNQNKPEISDLRVFNEFKNKGIGNTILDVIENEASKFTDEITLAVGLHYGYGNAQRLYVNRGYIPDGSGVWYGDKVLEQYENCRNDDSLVLYMSKKLK